MSKNPPFPPKPRDIAFLIFPEFQLLDAAGPIAAFEIANREAKATYRLRVVAVGGGLVRSSSGVSMPAEPLSRLREADTLILAGGQGTRAMMSDDALKASLKRLLPRVRRMSSVCSGAFLLAVRGCFLIKERGVGFVRNLQINRLRTAQMLL